MKTFFVIFVLLISGICTCIAQSEYNETLSLEGLSPAEIRQLFLSSTPGTDVLDLALQSRKSNTTSIISFSIGGLFTFGGIYAIAELNSLNKSLSNLDDRLGLTIASVTSFGIGGAAIIAGIIQNKRSKSYLDEAIYIYKKE